MIPLLSALVLVGALVGVSYVDLKERRIPDRLTLPLIAAGVCFGAWQGQALSSVIGAVAAYLCFVAIEQIYLLIRGRPGLGRGDAKLFATGGAWCGWAALPSILLIASLSGVVFALVTRRRTSDVKIPFGPFLSLGIVISFFAAFL